METIKHILDLFLHVDKHLLELVQTYGTWAYGILFGIVFLETGLVVTPFLPDNAAKEIYGKGIFTYAENIIGYDIINAMFK